METTYVTTSVGSESNDVSKFSEAIAGGQSLNIHFKTCLEAVTSCRELHSVTHLRLSDKHSGEPLLWRRGWSRGSTEIKSNMEGIYARFTIFAWHSWLLAIVEPIEALLQLPKSRL